LARSAIAETSGRSAQELLEEFEQTGNQAPFEEIVRRYTGMVYSVCYQVTRNAHDAEDAAQATFLTLASQRKANRTVKYVGPWLQHVAYRTSLDIRRARKRRIAREERHGLMTQQSGRMEQTAASLDAEELRGILRDELNKLPAKYRLPLILHYFGGMTPIEVSRELGCRPKTLGVRLFRGRRMLALNLAQRGIMLSGGLLAAALVDMIQTAVAQNFISNTSHAAVHVAAGNPVAASLASNHVMSMTRLAGRALVISKFKISLAVLLLSATAISGASEIVRRYAPSNWRMQFDLPNLLNDGLRSLLNGMRRPLRGIVEAPPVDAPNAAPVSVASAASTSTASQSESSTAQPAISTPLGWSPSGMYWTHLSVPAVPVPSPSTPRPQYALNETPGARVAPRIDLSQIPEPVQSRYGSRAGATALSGLGTGTGTGAGTGAADGAAASSASPPSRSGGSTSFTGPIPFTGPVADGSSSYGPQLDPNHPPRLPDTTTAQNGDVTGPHANDGSTGAGNGATVPPAQAVVADYSIAIGRGTHTYVWGDDAAANTVHAIDSVRFTMRNVRGVGEAQIASLPLQSPDIPTLPEGHHFIGVWEFDTSATVAGGVDLMVRYDDQLAAAENLDESILKLWAYDGGSWRRINDESFSRDIDLNLIGGHVDGFEYFAVSAPEPGSTTLLLLGAVAGALVRRGRRRRRLAQLAE
jgi:RNA polymerase sigma factor (sigma-70 family)